MEVNFSIEEFATKYANELNSLSGFPFKHFDLRTRYGKAAFLFYYNNREKIHEIAKQVNDRNN